MPATNHPTWLRVFAALMLSAALATAQAGRHELGLRLRAFERHLATETDDARRDGALAELERAVDACFRLDLRKVASHIDAADRALTGKAFSPAELLARSLQLQLKRRLVDAAAVSVSCKLTQLFEVEGVEQLPDGSALVVGFSGALAEQRFPLAELPTTVELRIAGLPVGDHELPWRIEDGDANTLQRRRAALSVAEGLERRFAAVDRAARAAARGELRTVESETLPALRSLLRYMQRGTSYETVLRGHALLREAEELAEVLASSDPGVRYYHQQRPGDCTLRVPVGRSSFAARLHVPEVPAGERRPLVVALHGAFGSENLFFDSYGDGALVELARTRGWFAVSPRNATGSVAVADLVDALAERYAIDEDRVFVVGHSMGAFAAMGAATRRPERLRAVAAVSGGGSVRRTEAFAALPFFVAAGGRDFGRNGSRRLRRAIEKVGANVEWHDYPVADHFTVMQLSLPDVFAFFDRHLD